MTDDLDRGADAVLADSRRLAAWARTLMGVVVAATLLVWVVWR